MSKHHIHIPFVGQRHPDVVEQIAVLVVLLIIAGMALPWALPVLEGHRSALIITLGIVGIWRWSWGCLHLIRALLYRYVIFPHLRRKSEAIVKRDGPIPDVAVMGTTYHEKPWITHAMIRGTVRELASLRGVVRPPQLIMITGCDEDDRLIQQEFDAAVAEFTPLVGEHWPPTLALGRGDHGKRPAIALGLHHLAAKGMHPDGVVLLIDGDSAPEAGALNKILPIFRLNRRMGALTTDQGVILTSPMWFAEWISLRFGQRHFYMCSLAFSRRLLCLTGRCSVFRSDVATHPGFIHQIEADYVESWLFGRYPLFSGDDKSTAHWLVANGYDTLYVPDAKVTTYEFENVGALKRAIANLRRWSGNMLRTSSRAVRMGPSRWKLFPWLCTIDQQLSMWTSLIGVTASIFAAIAGRYDFVACYILWILVTRTLRVVPAWRHFRRVSFWFVPLQLFSEWAGSIVKIWVYFHPVKQVWLNRGNRSQDTSGNVSFPGIRRRLATYFYAVSILCFVLFVGTYTGLTSLMRELPLIIHRNSVAESLPVEPATVHDPKSPILWGSSNEWRSPELNKVH